MFHVLFATLGYDNTKQVWQSVRKYVHLIKWYLLNDKDATIKGITPKQKVFNAILSRKYKKNVFR